MNDHTKHRLVMQTTFISAFLYTSFYVDLGLNSRLVGVGPLTKQSLWWD